MQLHVFIFVLVLSLAISCILRPLKHAYLMELVSLSAICVIMYLSLYFVVNESTNHPPATWLTHVVGILVVVIAMGLVIGVKYSRRFAK